MNKAKLTTILLYLRNALNYIEAAAMTAKGAANVGDLPERLASLQSHASADLTFVEDLRGPLGKPPTAS